MITDPDKLAINIVAIEADAQALAETVAALISLLNSSHARLWRLPDDELVEVLQRLHDRDRLVSTFMRHYHLATGANAMAEQALIADRAIAVRGREFDIVDGRIILQPK